MSSKKKRKTPKKRRNKKTTTIKPKRVLSAPFTPEPKKVTARAVSTGAPDQPNLCPLCDEQGRYYARQPQSDKFTLFAWKDCPCGNVWGYIFKNTELPTEDMLQ